MKAMLFACHDAYLKQASNIRDTLQPNDNGWAIDVDVDVDGAAGVIWTDSATISAAAGKKPHRLIIRT
jgi:hypothetical protein